MIKLFVSDLDGTLLSFEKKVTEQDISALKELKKNGVDVCLASGRMDVEIGEILTMVGEKYHRISQNGAFINTDQDESLHALTFENVIAKEVFEQVRSTDLITIIADYSKNYTERRDEIITGIESRMFSPIEENVNLLHALGQEVKASKISILGEYEAISELQKTLQERHPETIETYISDKQCLDVMPKNISKGNALKMLIEHLGIKPEEVACIGDSFNDIPMFNMTPHSFAMEDALPEVKKEAAYTASSVGEAIKQVLEMNKKQLQVKA
ncbi:HAD family hydrolase [Metabacillus idriensis]|uniref:HAD family hydrolase n=1 Tax=Metabacillus idriensis TaxID=324768 RepID=UPI002813DDD9|nr:HAD family hydrolase [Metabacillus idriensis]MDR0137039.1 HAD family hydrolase [Metabacillus idriensis]